jgi:hypothetical protein
MRVSINGLPHLEHGGRLLSTNLYFGTSAMALDSSALMSVKKRVNSAPATATQRCPALRLSRSPGTLTARRNRTHQRPSWSHIESIPLLGPRQSFKSAEQSIGLARAQGNGQAATRLQTQCRQEALGENSDFEKSG